MKSPLDVLDEDERRAILAAATPRSFVAGQTVFNEGDPADGVHLVASGRLAVRVTTPDGDVATLNVLGPGAWFGELSLLPGQIPSPRSATVLALDEARTLVLTRSAFSALCGRHPRIERLVVALMAERVKQLSSDVLEARYASLELRVRRSLDRLADVYGAEGAEGAEGVRVVIPLTQEHLAGLVGGARPRVNAVLQRLVAEGIVELGRGRVTVRDRVQLTRADGF